MKNIVLIVVLMLSGCEFRSTRYGKDGRPLPRSIIDVRVINSIVKADGKTLICLNKRRTIRDDDAIKDGVELDNVIQEKDCKTPEEAKAFMQVDTSPLEFVEVQPPE